MPSYQAKHPTNLRPRATEELDTAAALCKVSETPEWLDLSDHTFVLFGAGGIDLVSKVEALMEVKKREGSTNPI